MPQLQRSLMLLAAVCITAVVACSFTPPVAPQPMVPRDSFPLLSNDPGVVHGVLTNGLSYFLKRHRPADKRVQLLLVVKAGSLLEEDDQRGLSHFVEHMAFSGTKRFAKQTLLDFLERSGLRFGSDANAVTSFTDTKYVLSVPSEAPELLSTALDVLEDWAGSVSFDADQVERERAVILSEKTARQGAARRVGDQLLEHLFAGSRYAERSVIGDETVLKQASPQRIRDYYRRWYQPANMAVVIVGDVDPSVLKSAVESRFARLAPFPEAQALPDYPITLRQTPSFVVLRDAELTESTVTAVLEQRRRPFESRADYRRALIARMIPSMLTDRLIVGMRDAEAGYTRPTVSLDQSSFADLDLFSVTLQMKQGMATRSVESLWSELERLQQHGFVAEEAERTKRDLLASLEHQAAAESTRATSVVSVALAQSYLTGRAWISPQLEAELGKQLLPTISAEEISSAARDWLKKSAPLLLVMGPDGEALPERAWLEESRARARARKIEPYVAQSTGGVLLDSLPLPGKIISESTIEKLGVTIWKLANGARVVLKPTDFQKDAVVLRAISPGGTALLQTAGATEQEAFPSARLAAQMIPYGGVGRHDLNTINELLRGKVVKVTPFISECEEGLDGSWTPAASETFFQLLYLHLAQPVRSEYAFGLYKDYLRETLRNRDRDPLAIYAGEISRQLWQGALRRQDVSLESVAQLDLNRAFEFYRQRFGDVSDFTFVLVGDLDPGQLRPLVERYLASLPGSGRTDPVHDLGLRRKPGITKVRVKAGQDDRAVLTLLYHGESPWSESAHTDLVSLEGYLRIRLLAVLREDLGIVYDVDVSSEFERTPIDQYSLSIELVCKPSDLERLRSAVGKVIAELKSAGADASVVEKLVSQRKSGLERLYRSNAFWAARLADKLERNEDPLDLLLLPDLTNRVTRQNIGAAARSFLRDTQYLDAELLPAR